MLSVSEVAQRLELTIRQARRLVAAHPEAIDDGLRWLLPERCLGDLEQRRRPGRPSPPKISGTN